MIAFVVVALFAVALLAAALRSSRSSHRAWIVVAALVTGAVPVFLGDAVASVNLGRLAAWAARPDSSKTLSLVVVAEAIVAGIVALRALGGGGGPGRLAWASAVPGPCLLLGLLGVQTLVFDRATGLDFATASWGLAFAVSAAFGAAAWGAARLFSRERRAELGVRLAACQFLLGAALPLLLSPPRSQPGPGAIDPTAAVLAPALMAAVAAIGFARHAIAGLRAGRDAGPRRGERSLA